MQNTELREAIEQAEKDLESAKANGQSANVIKLTRKISRLKVKLAQQM